MATPVQPETIKTFDYTRLLDSLFDDLAELPAVADTWASLDAGVQSYWEATWGWNFDEGLPRLAQADREGALNGAEQVRYKAFKNALLAATGHFAQMGWAGIAAEIKRKVAAAGD